jgi:hypothetical protein
MMKRARREWTHQGRAVLLFDIVNLPEGQATCRKARKRAIRSENSLRMRASVDVYSLS